MTDDATADAAYFAGVVADIEAEAARRTADGDYPRALLRSLDEEFRRWIPDTGRGTGVEDAVRAIEAAAYIDPGVPVESNKRVGQYVKTAVRKATYFYHRHMAQQIAAFGIQVTRPMRLLDANLRQVEERVSALEARSDVNAAIRDELVAAIDLPPVPQEICDELGTHLAGAAGRVAVGELDDPTVLEALTERGVDAYGVGPAVDRHSTLELRDQQLAEHLRGLESGCLGGIALVGVTDRLSLNEQLDLLDLALGRLVDGGRLAVLVTDQGHWRSEAGAVAADLVLGRPLHPDTWRHLLEREGAEVDSTFAAGPYALVTATVRR